MNFLQSPAIAINETTHQQKTPVSTEEISMPLGWIAGSALGITAALVSLVWWAGKLSAKVDASADSIKGFEEKREREQKEEKERVKELKNEIRAGFKQELNQSETIISHSLETFMAEVRFEFKQIKESLDDRNNTVNRLKKKVDHIGNEMTGMAQQLQASGVAVHYRRSYDNGPPSQPHNYDDD
jgi:chaperonin cofactor prefoldin